MLSETFCNYILEKFKIKNKHVTRSHNCKCFLFSGIAPKGLCGLQYFTCASKICGKTKENLFTCRCGQNSWKFVLVRFQVSTLLLYTRPCLQLTSGHSRNLTQWAAAMIFFTRHLSQMLLINKINVEETRDQQLNNKCTQKTMPICLCYSLWRVINFSLDVSCGG